MIKKLRVTVDGKSYEVTAELPDVKPAPAPAPPAPSSPAAPKASAPLPSVPAAPAPSAASSHAGPGDVVSALAGRIVSVDVSVGQEVQEGDHVLTLEAMKMNTFVFAHRSGRVKAIHVQVGAAVQEGHVLLTLE